MIVSMVKEIAHYVPILTFIFSIYFVLKLYRHYRKKQGPANYILWWLIGVITFGIGTFTESYNALIGWSEINFKAWYVSGALLGGAPLAQGSVYLLMKPRTANILAILLVISVLLAGSFVTLSPVDYTSGDIGRLTGSLFSWQWVRYFSPFINLYALIFLVGGAIYSAIKYWKIAGNKADNTRFIGNIYIAVGALLPGIGGSFTRFGYEEVLFVTEFVGLILIYIGYIIMKSDKVVSIHSIQTN